MRRSAVAMMCVIVMCGAGACAASGPSGVELGHLRDLARRVEGGGSECPLAIPDALLRPSTVDRAEPVVPLRVDGPAANGVIDAKDADEGTVRITCRFQAGALSTQLIVVGVPRGDAVNELADVLGERGDGSVVLTFIAQNKDLPVGRARALPGKPSASFTRVTAAKGDVAVVFGVDRVDQADRSAMLPSRQEIDRNAVRIARSLSS